MGRSKKQRKLFKRRVKIKAKWGPKREECVSPLVNKYWLQRYDLFSRYDEGIKMDEQGWFSVTPEAIAVSHAQRCAGAGVVIDAFAGVGGNAIQFASMCHHVVAIDIDPKKIALASNNAKIYGVEDYIDFVVGDFFHLAQSLKGDIVFLSPPWGGPSYKRIENFTLDLLMPKDGQNGATAIPRRPFKARVNWRNTHKCMCRYSLFQVAQTITPNIIMYLPRNVDLHQVEELSWLSSPPLDVEIEENLLHGYSKGITAYFGHLAFAREGISLTLLSPYPTYRVEGA